MLISTTWVWCRLALIIIFGTVWLVFTILDTKRNISANKRMKELEQELKAQGMSDDQISEYFQQRKYLTYIYSGEQGSGERIKYKGGDK